MPVPPDLLTVGHLSWREDFLQTCLILCSIEGMIVWVLTPKIIPAGILALIIVPYMGGA